MNQLRIVSRSRGLTLTDCCVVMVACTLLFAVAVPVLAQKAKETDNRIKCAKNLRQIAQAATIYTAQDTRQNGKYPRTYYDPDAGVRFYTGIDAERAFDTDMGLNFKGPKPNDVTAALFHILKSTEEMTPAAFVCPSSDATPLPKTFDLQKKSNFPGPEHLSYSYNNPYGTKEAVKSGWRFDNTLQPEDPFAADMNPGESKGAGPNKVAFDAPAAKMASANSPNHWFEGQNVIYADFHVEWQTTPFCGSKRKGRLLRDNIYTNMKGVNEKTGVGGEVQGQPQVAGDAVLLPAVTDLAEGAKRTLPIRDPAQAPK